EMTLTDFQKFYEASYMVIERFYPTCKLPLDKNFYKLLTEQAYLLSLNNKEKIANNRVRLVEIIEISIKETEKKLDLKFPGLCSQVYNNQRFNFKQTDNIMSVRSEDTDNNFSSS